jgi:hypothetical protein
MPPLFDSFPVMFPSGGQGLGWDGMGGGGYSSVAVLILVYRKPVKFKNNLSCFKWNLL